PSPVLLHSSTTLLHIPSFPTRRSSDLHDSAGEPSQPRLVQGATSHLQAARIVLAGPLEKRDVRVVLGPTSRDGLTAISFDLALLDRKSTRLNSSHVSISYAVFCLKKKK